MSKKRQFIRGIVCVLVFSFVAVFATDSADAANRNRIWGWSQSTQQRQVRWFSSSRTRPTYRTSTQTSRSYRKPARRSVSPLPDSALPFYYILGGPTNYSGSGH
ncbi:MAG: hypothetical protein AAGD07_02370 [Planctomycetota bacterium]